MHPPFIYRFTNLYAEEKKMYAFLSKHTSKLLARDNGADAKATTIDKNQLIDKLMEMEKQNLMDPKRVLEQINTFIVAVSQIT